MTGLHGFVMSCGDAVVDLSGFPCASLCLVTRTFSWTNTNIDRFDTMTSKTRAPLYKLLHPRLSLIKNELPRLLHGCRPKFVNGQGSPHSLPSSSSARNRYSELHSPMPLSWPVLSFLERGGDEISFPVFTSRLVFYLERENDIGRCQ